MVYILSFLLGMSLLGGLVGQKLDYWSVGGVFMRVSKMALGSIV